MLTELSLHTLELYQVLQKQDNKSVMLHSSKCDLCCSPTMKTTSASSGPLKDIEKSSTSLSALVYFSLTGSSSGLGGLKETL